MMDELLKAGGLVRKIDDLPPEDGLDEWAVTITSIGPLLTRAERAVMLDHAQALRDRRGRVSR
jgi:hypothetical protein